MTVLVIRTVIMYALVVFALRIMGKRQIGELQPSELVVAIMISDLAAMPMSNMDSPIFYGFAPILTLVAAEIILSFICMKSQSIRSVVTGRPAFIINKGKINQKEMKKARYSLSDLLEELRALNVFDISSVDCAILETSGNVSVVTKDCRSERAYVLICDGVVQKATLKDSPFNDSDLKQFAGKNPIKDIFILSVDSNRKIYKVLKGYKNL